jgi:hypothetical protein
LRGGESPILPGERREQAEGPGSLAQPFLYHLALVGGVTIYPHLAPVTCGLGEEPLSKEGEPPQTTPNLAGPVPVTLFPR